MIEFITGDLLKANTEAVVNAVNTVGVMGKGIALLFKEKYPQNYKVYKKACDDGTLHVGEVFIVANTGDDAIKWIINFPSKKHWRNPSKYEYVETGLDDLVKKIKQLGIQSIAMPALGCGNGGLDWKEIKPLIIEKMEGLADVRVVVYEPV